MWRILIQDITIGDLLVFFGVVLLISAQVINLYKSGPKSWIPIVGYKFVHREVWIINAIGFLLLMLGILLW
jgi:hypothetical protein